MCRYKEFGSARGGDYFTMGIHRSALLTTAGPSPPFHVHTSTATSSFAVTGSTSRSRDLTTAGSRTDDRNRTDVGATVSHGDDLPSNTSGHHTELQLDNVTSAWISVTNKGGGSVDRNNDNTYDEDDASSDAGDDTSDDDDDSKLYNEYDSDDDYSSQRVAAFVYYGIR